MTGETAQSVSFVASRMKNGMIRDSTRSFAVNDRPRHGSLTVVKLCDMGKRWCLQISRLVQQ